MKTTTIIYIITTITVAVLVRLGWLEIETLIVAGAAVGALIWREKKVDEVEAKLEEAQTENIQLKSRNEQLEKTI